MKVTLSHHAKKRITKRFKIGKQTPEAWASQMLSKAIYCGIGPDDNGEDARMYSHRGATFMLAVDEDVVKTVIPPNKGCINRIRRKVTNFITEEITKMSQQITEEVARIDKFRDELEEEIAHLEDRLSRARSLSTKLALQARINAVRMRMDELPTESHEIRRELTRAARGVAAYV
ncbi:hypothetical protein [Bacillus sonorensis]|uniref:Uncharacterized protein n=1 Tax=Bacillus sonorensis TaxID=119858 RepID=A0ABN5AEV1_9BACI|nr:hypothetical protein [Bacillus sonorensis]ASB87679.1 hypothetical protein S101395_01143 [Bacillus sonorensis]RHJ13924.1 hypothetical protein DW143_04910 [Bacillus sonorensis]WPP37671.1 hypothetical protein SK061_05460 [Bacillus sonorensis]